MSSRPIEIVPKRYDAHAVSPGLLTHLSDIDDDYMIADPVPDFREWQAELADGRRIGKVDDIVVDTSVMNAKYIELELDHSSSFADDDHWLLVPAELIHVDDAALRIVVDQLSSGGLSNAPRHSGRIPNAEQRRAIDAYFGTSPAGAYRF